MLIAVIGTPLQQIQITQATNFICDVCMHRLAILDLEPNLYVNWTDYLEPRVSSRLFFVQLVIYVALSNANLLLHLF
jgi:hypothetical protein